MYGFAYVWPIIGMFMNLCTWLVVLISIHRYIAVLHPLQNAKHSAPEFIRRDLVLICTLSVVFELPRFFELDLIDVFNENTNTTVKYWEYSDVYNNHYYQLIYKNIIMLTLKKYLPIVIVSYCSVRMILSVNKRNKVHASDMKTGTHKELKITTTILAIMVTFVVTQLPTCAYPIARLFLSSEQRETCSVYGYYVLVADCFAFANSCINFVVYLASWRSFRSHLMGCCCVWKTSLTATAHTNIIATTTHRDN